MAYPRTDPGLARSSRLVSMHDPFLKKRLGQHHLRSGVLCRPLVEFLRPVGRRVLEIGAGGGVLSAELAAAGGRLVACEVDLEWAFLLRRRLAGLEVAGGCRILAIDALDLDWRRLKAPTLVTGNLPFNVATRLILDLLPHAGAVPRAAFMVQKEVAQRLVARPGDSAYGALSVLVAAHARARILGTVQPGSFRPPPRVAAAFVGLELAPPPFPAADAKRFTRLVRLAFAQRRKILRNSLAAGMGRGRGEALLRAAGLDPGCRAQELDLEAFVRLLDADRGSR